MQSESIVYGSIQDWPAADAVRDTLKNLGLKVEDTPAGPRWSLEN